MRALRASSNPFGEWGFTTRQPPYPDSRRDVARLQFRDKRGDKFASFLVRSKIDLGLSFWCQLAPVTNDQSAKVAREDFHRILAVLDTLGQTLRVAFRSIGVLGCYDCFTPEMILGERYLCSRLWVENYPSGPRWSTPHFEDPDWALPNFVSSQNEPDKVGQEPSDECSNLKNELGESSSCPTLKVGRNTVKVPQHVLHGLFPSRTAGKALYALSEGRVPKHAKRALAQF